MRYVDDTFTVMLKVYMGAFTDHINSIDEHIKFTHEVEEEGKIAFLDTESIRQDDGTIKHKVFRKATHTDQYLNFESHHILGQKLGVVKTLFDRCDSIVTTEEDRKEEKGNLCKALKNCGFPPGL